MGTKRNVDMSITPEELEDKKSASGEKKAKKAKTAEPKADADTQEAEAKTTKVVQKHERSKTYKKVRAFVDRTKKYDLKQAVELLKKTSYSKFSGTITADCSVKDQKLNLEVDFPHAYGKELKVVVWDEKIEKQVKAGTVDFDILLAKPDQMKTIAQHARVLGPKGVMPNPKTGTIVANPEKRLKELEKGHTQQVKTERKAPLIHPQVGKTDQADKEIIENIEALIKAIGPKKIRKMTLAATMSPGVKVDLEPYKIA